jgi:hypothetical protein
VVSTPLSGDSLVTKFKRNRYYTWSPSSTQTNLEFVPMLWGQREVDQFSSTINDTISTGGITAVLGMNECVFCSYGSPIAPILTPPNSRPQESSQSNLTPEQGAAMWKTYLEPLRSRGVRLGSPAPSSAPSGKTWIQDFLTACDGGCTVDFIALRAFHNPNVKPLLS